MATTTTMMYVARSLDMFMQIRAVSIKSVLSTVVSETELGIYNFKFISIF